MMLWWETMTAFCCESGVSCLSSPSASLNGDTTYGQARSAAGVAEKGSLARALALCPPERRQFRQRLALDDQIIHRLIGRIALDARQRQEEDALLGNAHLGGGPARRVEQRDAGEEGDGARAPQLVSELLGRVGSAGGGDDAGQAVDGVRQRDVVDGVEGEEGDDAVPLGALARVEA